MCPRVGAFDGDVRCIGLYDGDGTEARVRDSVLAFTIVWTMTVVSSEYLAHMSLLLLLDGHGAGSQRLDAGEQVPSMRVRVLEMGVSVREEGQETLG